MRLVDIDVVKLPEGFFEKIDNVPKFYNWLNSLPPIEAEPVRHGKWIKVGDNSYVCSVCGEVSCCNGNFCPDCGAKMDGGKE